MVLLNIPSRLRSSRNPSPTVSRTNSMNSLSPKLMAETSLVLKTTVVQGRNLAPKDKNGFSDPYIVLSWADYRVQTEAQHKTLNPQWNDCFDIPMSGASNLFMNCVCWDKDRFGKDYMGEFDVNLEDMFANGQIVQEPRWFKLKSSRKKATISGEIQLQLALADSSNENATEEQILRKWQLWQANFIQTPSPSSTDCDPMTLGPAEEEGSDYEEEEESPSPDDESTMADKPPKKGKGRKFKRKKKVKGQPYELNQGSDVIGVIFLEISAITDLPPERNMTRTGFDMDPFVVVSLGKKTYRTKHIRHSLNPVYDEKMLFQVLRHEESYSLNFAVVDRDKFSSNDFVAQTNLPLQEIRSTEPVTDPTTGLYIMEALGPDTYTPPSTPGLSGPSSSRSRFKFPLSRSSSGTNLAPRRQQQELNRRTSSNSLRNVAAQSDSTLSTSGEITTTAPSAEKGIPVPNNIEYDLQSYSIPLPLKNKNRWEDKHKPELHIKAKYIPYPALRQQFWRCMLRQYDTDDNGAVNRIELTTMLDTLGSTLSAQTIDKFFERFHQQSAGEHKDLAELTMDQAVICLEDQLSALSKKPVGEPSESSSSMPRIAIYGSKDTSEEMDDRSQYSVNTSNGSEGQPYLAGSRNQSSVSVLTQPILGPAGEEGTTLDDHGLEEGDKVEEHVIQISECPLCHQPRLNKRSEMDIVTHLATCASQDWRQVDKLVMGGFVTSSQAQRKWYSKVISKISYGGYKLGANSANILVQDRVTGLVQEERMSVYVRLGIRLLYKGLSSSGMENKKIRKLLYSLSVKQGKKFDNPASARDIKGFINFHQLDISEVLEPLDQFKSFNEFFYRKLKPGARPCSAPNNPKVVVSPADCRCVAFNRVDDATKIWIKGREFTISRLLGNAYPEDAKRFEKGALGIFRLAPQDYHRFHIPVDGTLGEPKLIKGEYYTVNPMAIRSALDVYGENVRVCVPIDSQAHGRVMIICVGAMMVGSTVITAKAGQKVKRTDELGYFQFGGSTLVVLFEPGRMVFDDDLVENSKGALETLIRVGMSIGHTPDMEAVSEKKENITHADKMEARRRIEGSMAPPRN